jgi:hypothetical protein
MAGAAGALAAGLGGAQSLEAALVHRAVDVSVPATTADYPIDIDQNGTNEFHIQLSDTTSGPLIKYTSLTAGDGLRRITSGDQKDIVANLPGGTLIAPGDPFTPTQNHLRLSGKNQDLPYGDFQVSDGPGYIGVEFSAADGVHYGYVGYQGTGVEGEASGHIYSIGYESNPGVGVTTPLADADANGVVDGNDFLAIQRGLGVKYTGANVAGFKAEYGLGATTGAVTAVPEPAAVSLLAAGAAGIPLYRRRHAKK